METFIVSFYKVWFDILPEMNISLLLYNLTAVIYFSETLNSIS